ncbi:MAG: hypothetical protein AB1416_02125, partial [Actinomycetota bacterium]
VSVGLPLLVLAAQVARGRGLRDALGGYEQLDFAAVSPHALWVWVVRHFAVLAVAVAVVPAVLAIAGLPRFLRRGADPGERAVAVTVVAMALPLIVEVAGFASVHSLRVEERNLFVVEPLLVLVGMAAVARRRLSVAGAAVGAVAVAWAVLALPEEALMNPVPYADTYALIAVSGGAGTLSTTMGTLLVALLVLGLLLGAAAIIAPGRPGVVAAFGVPALLIAASNHYVTSSSAWISRMASPYAGNPHDWIDAAAGRDSRVSLMWSSDETPLLAWQAEFWNRSVGEILTTPGDIPGPPGRRVDVDPGTGAVTSGGAPVVLEDGFVAAPGRFRPAGTAVATHVTAGGTLTLWRSPSPLRLAAATAGLAPDGWTGPEMEARAYACAGGVFRFRLALGFGTRGRVQVTRSGLPPVRLTVRSRTPRVFAVRVAPESPGGACVAHLAFLDAKTGNAIAQNGDQRVLGMRADPPEWVPVPT